MKNYSPEEKARLKENEHIIRLQTHCIFAGVDPTPEMIAEVKRICLEYYRENPEKVSVPKEILMGALDEKTEEVLEEVPF